MKKKLGKDEGIFEPQNWWCGYWAMSFRVRRAEDWQFELAFGSWEWDQEYVRVKEKFNELWEILEYIDRVFGIELTFAE